MATARRTTVQGLLWLILHQHVLGNKGDPGSRVLRDGHRAFSVGAVDP